MEVSTNQKSIREGKAEIFLTTGNVFYNPVQEFNRDLSIAVLTIFCEDYKTEKLAKVQQNTTNKEELIKEDVKGTTESEQVGRTTTRGLSFKLADLK